MLLGIYLFECYLRGIYKSPSALFRIKKSETAPNKKGLKSPAGREVASVFAAHAPKA